MGLRSVIKFKVVIDQDSLNQSKDRIGRSVNLGITDLLRTMADEGAAQLKQAYLAVGRRKLGLLWDRTEVVERNGVFRVSVYNKAEGMVYLTKSNDPDSTRTFPIPGRNLLAIIEEGAKPHKIRAKNPFKNPLRFPIRVGWAQSRSVGSAITKQGIGVGRFAPKFREDSMFEGAMVNHPGVVGSRFVQAVADRLAANTENAAATTINTKVNGA